MKTISHSFMTVFVLRMLLAVALLAPITVLSAPPTPERAAELFHATAAELDTGGDLFVYFEAENVFANLMAKIDEIVNIITRHEPEAKTAQDVVRRINDFLSAEGFHEFAGYGLSSKPLGDGNYLVKSFVARRPNAPAPRCWRMLGGEPRELSVLGMIPRDTAFLLSFDIRPGDFWAFVQQTVLGIAGTDAYKSMRAGLDELKRAQNVEVDALIASLSGEVAFAIQLSRDENVRIPLGKNSLEIPSPSALVTLGVKDGTLMSAFLDQVRKGTVPAKETTVEGVHVYLGPAMPDSPVPLQFAVAETDGFFLLASHPKVIVAAISAMKRGDGIKSDPAFASLMARVPRQNNGVSYVDERFNRTVVDIQVAQLREQNDDGVGAEIMGKIMGWFPMGSALSVRIMKPNGFQSQTVGPTGGKELVMAMAAMPIGMMAGIALPSFLQVRATAHEKVLINTLRIIDAAKEQWAMENNKDDGAQVTEEDIAPYLRPGSVNLPPGHTLRINPIGESPVIIKPDGTEITLP